MNCRVGILVFVVVCVVNGDDTDESFPVLGTPCPLECCRLLVRSRKGHRPPVDDSHDDAADNKERHTRLVQTLEELRGNYKLTTPSKDDPNQSKRQQQRRENVLRQALTKSRMQERKRKKKAKNKSGMLLLQYDSEEDNEKQNYKKNGYDFI